MKCQQYNKLYSHKYAANNTDKRRNKNLCTTMTGKVR